MSERSNTGSCEAEGLSGDKPQTVAVMHVVNVCQQCKQAVCVCEDMLAYCPVSPVLFHCGLLWRPWYSSLQRGCVQFSSSAQVVALCLKYT